MAPKVNETNDALTGTAWNAVATGAVAKRLFEIARQMAPAAVARLVYVRFLFPGVSVVSGTKKSALHVLVTSPLLKLASKQLL